jgi:hypothetical protein
MDPITVFTAIVVAPSLVRWATSSARGSVEPKNSSSYEVLRSLHQRG